LDGGSNIMTGKLSVDKVTKRLAQNIQIKKSFRSSTLNKM
jgi:hypothetical protein